MRRYIILVVLAIILSFFLGIYIYKLEKIDEEIAFDVQYITNKNENILYDNAGNLVKTSSNEDKINPNTKLIEKVYYSDCNHIVQTVKKVTEDMVNKNKEEFQVEYFGWDIQKFTNAEVVVYKEMYDFCDQHYCLKDVDGTIMVYKLDKYGKEKELIEDTAIQTKYLSEVDIANLKNGINVYSIVELNKKLEDYE